MEILTQYIIPYVILYKYVALFLIAFIAAFMIPVPSGSILMIASGFASAGYFNIYFVILVYVAGNLLGDNLSYFIARSYGHDVLLKIGFRRIIESKTFTTLELKFRRSPGLIVFVSRFEAIGTLAINILSGLSHVSYRKFFL